MALLLHAWYADLQTGYAVSTNTMGCFADYLMSVCVYFFTLLYSKICLKYHTEAYEI